MKYIVELKADENKIDPSDYVSMVVRYGSAYDFPDNTLFNVGQKDGIIMTVETEEAKNDLLELIKKNPIPFTKGDPIVTEENNN